MILPGVLGKAAPPSTGELQRQIRGLQQQIDALVTARRLAASSWPVVSPPVEIFGATLQGYVPAPSVDPNVDDKLAGVDTIAVGARTTILIMQAVANVTAVGKSSPATASQANLTLPMTCAAGTPLGNLSPNASYCTVQPGTAESLSITRTTYWTLPGDDDQGFATVAAYIKGQNPLGQMSSFVGNLTYLVFKIRGDKP